MKRTEPTARQEEVLTLYRRGLSKAQICRELGMSSPRISEIVNRWTPKSDRHDVRPHLPDQLVTAARRLWIRDGEQYLSTSQIARKLEHLRPGLTKNSIVGIADRYDFPQRPTPILGNLVPPDLIEAARAHWTQMTDGKYDLSAPAIAERLQAMRLGINANCIYGIAKRHGFPKRK